MNTDIENLRSRLEEAMGRIRKNDDPAAEAGPEPDRKELWADEVARLRQAHVLLSEDVKFRIGDIVTWKDGLRNMEYPGAGRPALVTEVLKNPVEMSTAPGSPYFREPLTIKGMVAVDDRTHLEFRVNGRRFRKADGP